jgi:hypothetical protein
MVSQANAPQWSLANTFAQTLGPVLSLAKKGNFIYASNKTSLTSWDATTLEQVASIDLQSQVNSIKIIGETLFALLSTTGQVAKFSLSPLTQVSTFSSGTNTYCLDDKSVYTASGGSSITVYDQETLNQTAVYNTTFPTIMKLAYAKGIIAINNNNGAKLTLGFCDATTGNVLKTVENTSELMQLSTTTRGNFLLYGNQLLPSGTFQVWDSKEFVVQTSITVQPVGPIYDILEAPDGIFVAGQGIGLLRNTLTLEQIEDFGRNTAYCLSLIDDQTMISGMVDEKGICLWKKTAEASTDMEPLQDLPQSWIKTQEIPVTSGTSNLTKLETSIYTTSTNQITRWNLVNGQLVSSATGTMSSPIQNLVNCAGKLFCTLNGSGSSGPFQLISIDPLTLQPGDIFTSDFPISCATASETTIYLGCAQGVVYYVNPATLAGLKIGTDQVGITAIAVTAKALAITANGVLASFDPISGTALQSAETGYQYPMLAPAGDDYMITAESAPMISNPFGMKIFPLTSNISSTLPTQTQMKVELPIFSALTFDDQIVVASTKINRFTNDIDLKPLGALANSSCSYNLLKITEGLFLATTQQGTLQVWQRGVDVEKAFSFPWSCVVQ